MPPAKLSKRRSRFVEIECRIYFAPGRNDMLPSASYQQKIRTMDVTASYWRQFSVFVKNQQKNQQRWARRRAVRLLVAQARAGILRAGVSPPVPSNAAKRETRFTIH
jgi:hypothetical protein